MRERKKSRQERSGEGTGRRERGNCNQDILYDYMRRNLFSIKGGMRPRLPTKEK